MSEKSPTGSEQRLMKVEHEEFQAWVRHPVTQIFMARVQEWRESQKEALASGIGGDEAQQAVGICRAFREILTIRHEDIAYE